MFIEFGEGQYMNDESKTCPFCAESIKRQAIKCKHCGSEVPVSAAIEKVVGSFSGLKEMLTQGTRKIGLLGAVFLVLILGIVIIVNSKSRSPDIPNASKGVKSTDTTHLAEPELKDENTVKIARIRAIGEPFGLGNFAYKITKVERRDYIGNEFLVKQPESGGTFLIVYFQITNYGNESATIAADDFKLQTEDDISYSPDSEAISTLLMSGDGRQLKLS